MVDAFLGKWKLTDSHNFDNYLGAMGVALVWRGLAATATPTQEWTLDGDKVHIKTTSLARTHEQEFTLGKEFDETRIDGEQSKSVVVVEGAKLKHTMTLKDGTQSVVWREIDGGKLVMTMHYKDVTAVRKYDKV
jgi:fatty acid-binding protein 7